MASGRALDEIVSETYEVRWESYIYHVRGSFVLWRLRGLKVFREANTLHDVS